MSRNAILARLHCAKRDLGLDDDTYRDILERVTGKRSASNLGSAAIGAVLDEFKRLGWQSVSAPRKSNRPVIRKVFALWGALKELGVLRDHTREGLRGFIRRMTHGACDDPDWMTDEQARIVIEALKDWVIREDHDEIFLDVL